jgi:uncharacterized membrane protein
MSTLPSLQGRSWLPRPKHALFAFIALMLSYVLYHNEHFLVDASDPSWPHYRAIGRWLLPHGLIGATALLLGATQFSTRLRTRHTRLHRLSGRIYVTAVFIAAPLGAYIQYLDERVGGARSFTIATSVFAAMWLLATGMAFWCIRTRRIEQHRQWVTRSYAMACIFLEVRVIAGLTGWENLVPDVSETIVWTCVALAYPLADVILLLDDSLRPGGRPARLA